MIIKSFNRQSYQDKYKDVLEVIRPNAKIVKSFMWHTAKGKLSEEVSFSRLRKNIMIENLIFEDTDGTSGDWQQLHH
jgi:hypothetical protein